MITLKYVIYVYIVYKLYIVELGALYNEMTIQMCMYMNIYTVYMLNNNEHRRILHATSPNALLGGLQQLINLPSSSEDSFVFLSQDIS